MDDRPFVGCLLTDRREPVQTARTVGRPFDDGDDLDRAGRRGIDAVLARSLRARSRVELAHAHRPQLADGDADLPDAAPRGRRGRVDLGRRPRISRRPTGVCGQTFTHSAATSGRPATQRDGSTPGPSALVDRRSTTPTPRDAARPRRGRPSTPCVGSSTPPTSRTHAGGEQEDGEGDGGHGRRCHESRSQCSNVAFASHVHAIGRTTTRLPRTSRTTTFVPARDEAAVADDGGRRGGRRRSGNSADAAGLQVGDGPADRADERPGVARRPARGVAAAVAGAAGGRGQDQPVEVRQLRQVAAEPEPQQQRARPARRRRRAARAAAPSTCRGSAAGTPGSSPARCRRRSSPARRGPARCRVMPGDAEARG